MFGQAKYCNSPMCSSAPYVFAFTRHVLGWQATDYSLWVTYKNLMATAGKTFARILSCDVHLQILFSSQYCKYVEVIRI